MCLGELAEVLAVDDAGSAEVTSGGRRMTVLLLAVDGPVAPGDWLVVHSGLALERVSAEEAEEAARIRAATGFEEEP